MALLFVVGVVILAGLGWCFWSLPEEMAHRERRIERRDMRKGWHP
jgi:hypothetical protein